MKHGLIFSALLLSLALTGCEKSVLPDPVTCAPMDYTKAQMLELRQTGFAMTDDAARQQFALALTACLSDPNPKIRDGVAYEGLYTWMRARQLNGETLRTLKQELLNIINAPDDAEGFKKPFAALVLSEVARVDRLSPFLSDYDRAAFTREAANYVKSIKDYRGYDDRQGWRHGTAHGADWLLQLSLNDRLKPDEYPIIRDAVASQIRADKKHAYIHGEGARLARPILFLARRNAFTQGEWSAWLTDIAAPAPLKSWSEAFNSESGLAQRHNVKIFLNAIYLNASVSDNAGTRQLLPGAREALKGLP